MANKLTTAVNARRDSPAYAYFRYGEDYYNSRNTEIMHRKKQVYLESIDKVIENRFSANHILPSGHFQKIVDQKVMYLLGNGVKFTNEKDHDPLNAYFDTTIDEFLIDAGLDASKYAEAWAYAYKMEGKLHFTLIPPHQLTPIYDEYNRLIKMIRCYMDADEKGEIEVMLVFSMDGVEKYIKRKDAPEYSKVESFGHFTRYKKFAGSMVDEPEQMTFSRIPFIPLFNNREKLSDLHSVKSFIDVYDVINSDFANNIDDMQDAFYTLKGYSGDTDYLGEFMKQLKAIKAVPVGMDGEIESHQLEIPVEARKVFLDLLTKDIYKFAMAVDLTMIQGQSLTNVMIKAMFADLDLKCDKFESQLRKFVNALIDFINTNDAKTFSKDYEFERSMIVNRQEAVDTLIKTVGILSYETIREKLPYEIDEKIEAKRLEKESQGVDLGETDDLG